MEGTTLVFQMNQIIKSLKGPPKSPPSHVCQENGGANSEGEGEGEGYLLLCAIHSLTYPRIDLSIFLLEGKVVRL